jgi:hypothetical protein
MFQPMIPGSYTAVRSLRGPAGIRIREFGSAAPIFPLGLATASDGTEVSGGAIRAGDLIGTTGLCCLTETFTTPAATRSITGGIIIAAEPMAAAVYMERIPAPTAHAPVPMDRAVVNTELVAALITGLAWPLDHSMEAGKRRAVTLNHAGRVGFIRVRTVATSAAASREAFRREAVPALAVDLIAHPLTVADPRRTAAVLMAEAADGTKSTHVLGSWKSGCRNSYTL